MFPGLILEIGRRVPEASDALCIEAGSACLFDDMIKFMVYTIYQPATYKIHYPVTSIFGRFYSATVLIE